MHYAAAFGKLLIGMLEPYRGRVYDQWSLTMGSKTTVAQKRY